LQDILKQEEFRDKDVEKQIKTSKELRIKDMYMLD
jgi:hypothetical protein